MILSAPETRRGLRISNFEAVACNIHTPLIGNAFLTGFALAWGANDLHLGLLGAIPCFATLFQMLGAYLTDCWPSRRRELVSLMCLLSRVSWLAAAIMPFIGGWQPAHAVAWILAVYLCNQIAANLMGPGWMSWMAVLVPDRIRGRFMGFRGRLSESAAIVTVLAAGAWIDHAQNHGMERVGFAAVHALAALAGIASFCLLWNQPHPAHQPLRPRLEFTYFARPLKNDRFRRLIAFNICWLLGWNVWTPFMNAHLIKNLHWDFRHLAILAVLNSLTSIVASPYWGRFADRRGHKSVLKFCSIGLLHLPLYYIFCPWNLSWPIYCCNALYGIFWSGFLLSTFSLALKALPADSRAMGSALLNGATGPAAFLSAALSGWLAQHLASLHWRFGLLDIANYQLLFALSILLRIPTLFQIDRIDDTRDHAISKTVPVSAS